MEEERPHLAALLQTLTELGAINVVLVSMVLPTEVVSVTKALVLAVASPALLLVIHRASVVPVLSDQVLALATVLMAPVGREMAVWVRNAFSFDSDFALAWISETERLDYDALGGPCKYPVLDSNFTSAIRECVKTRAVRDKMNRLTEAAQNMIPPQGIKGRQILKLLLNHLGSRTTRPSRLLS